MANLDFTPLYRSTVGFDRVPRLLQSAMRLDNADISYPPYNIEKVDDDSYRIVIALAGFDRDGLEIITEQGSLTVRGKMPEREDAHYLHRGIAGRSFERKFDLADHIEVKGATLENGLLTIELLRELPEKLKPRTIDIKRVKSKAIEHSEKIAA